MEAISIKATGNEGTLTECSEIEPCSRLGYTKEAWIKPHRNRSEGQLLLQNCTADSQVVRQGFVRFRRGHEGEHAFEANGLKELAMRLAVVHLR